MQLTPSKGQFIEKIIHNKDGKLVRAIFCVYQNGGRIKARLVEVSYISESISSCRVYCLSGFNSKSTPVSEVLSYGKIVSPYTHLNILYSFGSKPRAPTK